MSVCGGAVLATAERSEGGSNQLATAERSEGGADKSDIIAAPLFELRALAVKKRLLLTFFKALQQPHLAQ